MLRSALTFAPLQGCRLVPARSRALHRAPPPTDRWHVMSDNNHTSPPQHRRGPQAARASLRTAPTRGQPGLSNNRWHLMGSVCVSRHPVLCRPLNPTEAMYTKHLNELEVEESLLSDFELKVLEDEARKFLGETEVDGDEAASELRSALESQDLWNQQETAFRGSLNLDSGAAEGSFGSQLSRQLVLVKKEECAGKVTWSLPQALWQEGETLRQTCERIVDAEVDPALGVEVVGNAPIAFYKYKFPKAVREELGVVGAKVFLYRGRVSQVARQSLACLSAPVGADQRWLPREALAGLMMPSYATTISNCMVDDS